MGQILFLRLFSSSRRDRVLAIFSPKEVVSGEIGKGIRFRKETLIGFFEGVKLLILSNSYC